MDLRDIRAVVSNEAKNKVSSPIKCRKKYRRKNKTCISVTGQVCHWLYNTEVRRLSFLCPSFIFLSLFIYLFICVTPTSNVGLKLTSPRSRAALLSCTIIPPIEPARHTLSPVLMFHKNNRITSNICVFICATQCAKKFTYIPIFNCPITQASLS